MFHKLIVAFAVLLLGVTSAAAQSCPEFIQKRQTLMKKSGEEAKIGTAMIKGEMPFDAAKVQEIYAAFAEDAKQMPTLFPDCSKTGAKTTAAPAIWERMDDFKAAIAKFADDIKAAQGNAKDELTRRATTEGGPPHGRPAFYLPAGFAARHHTHFALETNCGRESSVLGLFSRRWGMR